MRGFVFILGVAAFFSIPAMAYVDPGSGYYLFQLLGAMAVGSLYYVVKLPKKFLTRVHRKPENAPLSSLSDDSNREAA